MSTELSSAVRVPQSKKMPPVNGTIGRRPLSADVEGAGRGNVRADA
jgi:hypothetical protein